MSGPPPPDPEITNAVDSPGNANLNDINQQEVATATTTHGEKITHAVNALKNAGLSNNGSSGSSSGLGDKKWIIIGAAAGGVVFLVILILLCVFLRARRRRRRQRAYAAMGGNGSRSIDMKDNSNEKLNGFGGGGGRVAEPQKQTGMRGFLMPSWRASKGKGKEGHQRNASADLDLSSRRSSFDPVGTQSYDNRGRGLSVGQGGNRSRDPSRHSRSRSRGPNTGPLGEDVFNAEKEMMPSESDSMLVGQKLGERNFESGYEGMDTEYRSSVMGQMGGGQEE